MSVYTNMHLHEQGAVDVLLNEPSPEHGAEFFRVRFRDGEDATGDVSLFMDRAVLHRMAAGMAAAAAKYPLPGQPATVSA